MCQCRLGAEPHASGQGNIGRGAVYFRVVQQASAIDIVAEPINHNDQAEKDKIGPYESEEECRQSIGGNNKRKEKLGRPISRWLNNNEICIRNYSMI
jgi:hypothetical protein